MGGVIRLDMLGKGSGQIYAIAYAPVTGGQKITGQISVEIDIKQLATDLAGSADWGNAGAILLFVDDNYNVYWLHLLLYATAAAGTQDFFPYNPDTDVVGARIIAEDATHKWDTSQCTYNAAGELAKTTKTVTVNPCTRFAVTPLYLTYVMFHSTVGGNPGAKGWRGNFYRIKATQ